MNRTIIASGRIATPMGELAAAFTANGLARLGFLSGKGAVETVSPDPRLNRLRDWLDDYFAGAIRPFELPLDLGGTPFQQRVWRALVDIPVGTTTSYAALAAHIGRPRAVRAVGAANGRNPVAIVVPCHRVVGADGELRGYAWGLDRKQALLELEERAARSGGRVDVTGGAA